MNMQIILNKDSDFLDLYFEESALHITDYQALNKKIVIDNSSIKLIEKNPEEISTLADLKKAAEKLINTATTIFTRYPPDNITPSYFYINNSEAELLAEELVMDILFDNYIHHSENITQHAYATHIGEILETSTPSDIDSIRKKYLIIWVRIFNVYLLIDPNMKFLFLERIVMNTLHILIL